MFYSYWLCPSTLGFDRLQERHRTALFVTRTHRYDLFSETTGASHLPFQKEIVRTLDRIYPCSEVGADYLRKKFPTYSGKIESRHLGVQRQDRVSSSSRDGVLRILSCSRVVPLKRLGLLASALMLTKRPVMWTHLGHGPGFQQLATDVRRLPGNVRTDLRGALPHAEILDYFRLNPVDLFVNVSASEGLPVSLMEAMSFGVPCCATDVGGTQEIVNAQNGYLLPSNFSIERFSWCAIAPADLANTALISAGISDQKCGCRARDYSD